MKQLDHQADRIEQALYYQGLHGVHVTGGTIGPRWVRLSLALPWGIRPGEVIRLQDDLSHRLGCVVRVALDGNGALYVELPRERSAGVSLLKLVEHYTHAPTVSPLLGIDAEGQPLFLRLPSPDVAHALVVGVTGSGKTVLARDMALSLAAFNSPAAVQLLLIDPKRRKFEDLAGLPHLLADVIAEPAHAVHVLGELERLMIERDRAGITTPRVVAILDELADLVLSERSILDPITRLAQRGREAGIHLIVCTQKPTVDVVGGLAKANFPVRLVGSVTTPEEAKIASGIAQSGAERLLGRGDFLLVHQGRVHTRLQAAYASPQAARRIMDDIRARLPEQVGPRVRGDDRREMRWQAPDLQVVVDNRNVEADARRVLRTPGWLAGWWDAEHLRFRYGHQTAIGGIIQRENEGAGYRYINRVEQELYRLLVATSTTTPPAPISAASAENARAGE